MHSRMYGIPMPRRHHEVAGTGVLGLLSNELWDSDDDSFVDPTPSARFIKASRPAKSDEADILPDTVINLYPDLDDASRSFLRNGPRDAHERLAYAQRVHPLAHASARLAPAREQRVFGDRGVFDANRSFIGPNGRVYLRDDNSNEFLGARIRRGYERAIGGFATPSVAGALQEIRDARRDKRADVQSALSQPSPQEERRRAFLREQRINPSTWTLAEPLDDNAQKVFQESGQLWPAIAPFAFVGPDGIVYRRNESVREDPLSQYRRVREWLEAEQRSAAAQPPDPWELYWQAVGAGAVLPGPTRVPAVQPRLPDQPLTPTPVPGASPEAKLGGRLGNAKTRAQIERLAQYLKSRDFERYLGENPRRVDGKLRHEELIPGPFGGPQGTQYVDLSLKTPDRSRIARINTTNVDPRTGKPTLEELDTLLRMFRRVKGDVLGISKDWQ